MFRTRNRERSPIAAHKSGQGVPDHPSRGGKGRAGKMGGGGPGARSTLENSSQPSLTMCKFFLAAAIWFVAELSHGGVIYHWGGGPIPSPLRRGTRWRMG